MPTRCRINGLGIRFEAKAENVGGTSELLVTLRDYTARAGFRGLQTEARSAPFVSTPTAIPRIHIDADGAWHSVDTGEVSSDITLKTDETWQLIFGTYTDNSVLMSVRNVVITLYYDSDDTMEFDVDLSSELWGFANQWGGITLPNDDFGYDSGDGSIRFRAGSATLWTGLEDFTALPFDFPACTLYPLPLITEVTPDTVTLAPGGTQAFAVTGTIYADWMISGTSVQPDPNGTPHDGISGSFWDGYTEEGPIVSDWGSLEISNADDWDGLSAVYTAPMTPGTYYLWVWDDYTLYDDQAPSMVTIVVGEAGGTPGAVVRVQAARHGAVSGAGRR